jgi:NADP-dependent 3-hydroxy acid dehydrogenase YdfG
MPVGPPLGLINNRRSFRGTISVHHLFREDLLERLAEEAATEQLAVTVRRVDVTNKNDIDDLSTDIQTLDILFNCAG